MCNELFNEYSGLISLIGIAITVYLTVFVRKLDKKLTENHQDIQDKKVIVSGIEKLINAMKFYNSNHCKSCNEQLKIDKDLIEKLITFLKNELNSINK